MVNQDKVRQELLQMGAGELALLIGYLEQPGHQRNLEASEVLELALSERAVRIESQMRSWRELDL